MIKQDEKDLRCSIKWMYRLGNPHPLAGDLAEILGIPERRANYLFEKWTDKGWWDYGVSARTGWLTDKGKEEFGV